MDSIKSFKGYGKVDELEQQAFKRKTRKRIIIVSVSVVLLIVLVVGVVVGTVANKKNDKSSDEAPTSPAAAIRGVCAFTEYQDSCRTSLGSLNTSDPMEIFKFSMTVAVNSLEKLSGFTEEYKNKTEDPFVREALNVCDTVLDDAVESLNNSLSLVQNDEKLSGARIDDLKTWLSTVLTDQETCLDSLEETNATFTEEVELLMKNSTEFASNCLAIVTKVFGILGGKVKLPNRRRLLGTGADESGFPVWVSAGDRRLLQQSNPRPDLTVASDGSGDVRTLKEAVSRLPKKSERRFVIYVKRGVYKEQVLLDKSYWNLMLYGDGKDATILTFDKNVVDGTPTFSTATFGIAGKGFIARDIGFRNTAGAIKHQAVAFRSGSDLSVFYRCSFNAFQDTLYPHSNRQFYRECDITGTVDFIFGNAAVVLQRCNILPRQPMPNQFVTITAQGKRDPNMNTGTSIQRCTIRPFDALTARTYLGRPWKDYSTTVIMQTEIGGFLNPLGWAPWVTNVVPPSTIFYGEYQNTGPGANTSGRVKWPGYRPVLTQAQASRFYVPSFIQGNVWLPPANVVYD